MDALAGDDRPPGPADPAGATRCEPDGLFVYGTLRFPEVLQALLGRVPELEPARAVGWRVKALPGVVYPGLVADPGGVADGLLMTGLSEAERRLLDAYEGESYEPRRMALDDGRRAWTYVWKGRTEPDDWNPARFAERDLPAYLDQWRP
ncbi:Gamma-glutamyl cyclotransferase, AIG2-like [Thermomonospora echinospora]|uniref:Putative gamma-glutamylcyclotransferase n=1 Tax=Thermomonospora echinospora TaxID=1992 RepID=A0A1H6CI08_9ACTN|nr:gamma-glutamylcyclotransferase family protein [Thermomonospora echinospora]SEG72640.1 Gamma-glutamyl cyclotransferase, AIG2-like [Thermomonospora echinospora]